jgi:hypothetical protein
MQRSNVVRPRTKGCAGVLALLFVLTGGGCGGANQSTPSPPEPRDSWYFYPVICGDPGCPGLTNVEVDRTTSPPRVTLPAGRLTSLRAKSLIGCGQVERVLTIRRWIPENPSVIEVEPSSSESAIVTALRPGVSRVSAERVLPDGSLSTTALSDPYRLETGGCAQQPEFVFEVTPGEEASRGLPDASRGLNPTRPGGAAE